MKNSGKPDDRKGQVRFDVAGAGNGFTVTLVRHRQTKETATDRRHLRNTAPVLDPTLQSSQIDGAKPRNYKVYSSFDLNIAGTVTRQARQS